VTEAVKNLGDIGTFGLFTLALLVVFFRWALPPILEKLRGQKPSKEEAGQPPQIPPEVAVQLEALAARLGKIEEAMESTNLGLVLHQIAELAKKVEDGFRAAKGSRRKLHDEVDSLMETCAAEHGRPVGRRSGR
jgi:hypothetical protein